MSDAVSVALALGDIERVVSLYEKAAAMKEEAGDIDAACFLLTHAWIHALEAGDGRAEDIRGQLIAYGRE
ncbi:MAG: hypothetical protein AAF718_11130 [Pseudomonadota bacterium]